MSEWRKDPIVDRWVIISTERGKRPFDYKEFRREKRTNLNCPLCEGNEKQTPPEIVSFRKPGSGRDAPGWWVRVVPNKFPAVRVEEEPDMNQNGIYKYMSGIGAHEVIVESTYHTPELDTQTEKQIEEVIWIWRARSLDLRKDKRLRYIQIFKNTGSLAGASLEHTHSQLIATPIVPVDVMQEIEGMKQYASRTGKCAVCDIVNQEIYERERLVMEGEKFMVFTPFASRFPFETWLVPKEHQHDFALIREDQVQELACFLKSILRKLSIMISNLPYNLILHTAPINTQKESHFHWHIEILPRLTTIAGFELGTGYFINPTPPEMAAKTLRETREIYLQQDGQITEVQRYV